MDRTINGIVETVIFKFILINPTININPKSKPNPTMLMYVSILLGVF